MASRFVTWGFAMCASLGMGRAHAESATPSDPNAPVRPPLESDASAADEDNWFYSYWDDGYTATFDWDRDGNYDYAYTYFDFDGDGNYDRSASYYDRDDDGTFDEVEYYTFEEPSGPRDPAVGQGRISRSPGGGREQRATGEIGRTRLSNVRGVPHQIVEVEITGGHGVLADLGPAEALERYSLEVGDRVEVRGPAVQAGDRRVIVAQSFVAGGEEARIRRVTREVKGRIADTRRVKMAGEERLIAVLASEEGATSMVDLGPLARLEREPERGEEVVVRGVPVTVSGRRVILAQELDLNGEPVTIRPAPPGSGGGADP